jgi:hypothetical protein
VGPLHLGVGLEFVEKNQAFGRKAVKPREPGPPLLDHVGTTALGGKSRLLFRGSFSRASVLQTVPRLAGFPSAAAISASVASGLSAISLRIFSSSWSFYVR